VTGALHSYEKGDEIEAPEGEMQGLPGVAYETRVMKPRYVVKEGQQGWHKVYDTREEEYVDGESERSAEAAQENADRLNG
jgi:hypothetical protein